MSLQPALAAAKTLRVNYGGNFGFFFLNRRQLRGEETFDTQKKSSYEEDNIIPSVPKYLDGI